MRRSNLALKLGACIETFLRKEYRKHSHLDGGLYYWNERDVHWALYEHLRNRTQSYSIGSGWWIHAEGTVGRPRYARKTKWKGKKRADIVLVNHSDFKRKWLLQGPCDVQYEAMIEIKLIWSGSGLANSLDGINKDLRKLESCLSDRTTKNAFLILLDGLDGRHRPYLQDSLGNTGKDPSLVIYHWPDSESAVEDPKKADFKKY